MVATQRTKKMKEVDANKLIDILEKLGYGANFDGSASAAEQHVRVTHFLSEATHEIVPIHRPGKPRKEIYPPAGIK